MNITKKIICLCLAILLTFSLVGCVESTSSQIVFEISGMPTTLDPQLVSTETEMLIVRNIYEGLMRKNVNGDIVTAAAESYTKNGNTYTFKLRDNLSWSDGTKIVADDFKFSFVRAVDPTTNSPFANQLACINGADEILSGKANPSTLSVTVKDDMTVEFSINSDENAFLELLCAPISMPCNQKFFEKSYGKYGRDVDSVLSNGSFSLRNWNTETQKITLVRSKHYDGQFIAKPYSIALVNNDFDTIHERLNEETVDGVFLNDYIAIDENSDSYTKQYISDTIWALVMSEKLPVDIRKALFSSINESALQNINNPFFEYSHTFLPKNSEQDILQSIQNNDFKLSDAEAKTLFSDSVKKDYKGKFPTISILYYDNDHFKNVATSLAAHWQSILGAFINIEPINKTSRLQSIYSSDQYYIAIVPFSSEQPNARSFYSQFTTNGKNSINNKEFDNIFSQSFNEENANKLNQILTNNYKLKPLCFGSNVILMNNAITDVMYLDDYGKIDFCFAKVDD